VKLSDLPERYRKQAAAQIAAQDRVAVPAANHEPDTGNVAARAHAPEKDHPPVSVRMHSIRKRLPDYDNLYGKWVLDAIVAAGILPADSPKHVKEVPHTQEQGSPETTTIEIYEQY
jgi:hypothetical protein